MAPVPFGKYVLHERLASTPVVDIYRATTRQADGGELPIVVKRLCPKASQDADFLTGFVDEARIAALLNHPNIAKTYEWGKHQDSLFFALEYIQGTNLASLMQSVAEQNLRFPPTIGLHVVSEVLAGLAYAHGLKDPYGNPLGLVHRDVSPPNVVISESGEVKLVDFGLAKLADRLQNTLPGAFLGKFTYMSPEQIRRKEVDVRADIYSCGVMLYELLTGIKLRSKGEESDIRFVLEAARSRPPASVHKDIPAELDQLVARAMEEDPSGRPATAVDMLGELGQFLDRWDRKVDAASLAAYLVETFSGQAGQPDEAPGEPPGQYKPSQTRKPQKPKKAGFAFGEATSQWMTQGDNMKELVKIHPAPGDDQALPAPEPAQAPAPELAPLEPVFPAPRVPTQQSAPEQPVEAESKPPPRRKFSAGSTVMAVLEGGLGKRRQIKTLLFLLGGAALVVLVVVFIIISLGAKDETGKEIVEQPPPTQVEAFTGAVQFKTEPDGALVFVDGDLVKPEGQPPRIMGLRAGMHRIKLAYPGYLPWEGDLTFEVDRPRVIEQKLEERIGSVVITSRPSKAKIYLNGELVGQTPKTIEKLPAAKSHKVVLKARGRRWEPLRFSIEPPDWPETIDEGLKIEKKLKKRMRRRRRR